MNRTTASLKVALVATTAFFAISACGEGIVSSGGGALEIFQAELETGVSGRFATGSDVVEFRTLRLLAAQGPTGEDWAMGAAEAGDERLERYLSEEDKIGGVHIAALFVDPARQVRAQHRTGLEVEENEDAPFEARERSRELFALAAEALQQAALGPEFQADQEALARLASGALDQLATAADSRSSLAAILSVQADDPNPSGASLTLGGRGRISQAGQIGLEVCLKQSQLPTWMHFTRNIKCVSRQNLSATSLRIYERGRFCPAPGKQFQLWNFANLKAGNVRKAAKGFGVIHRCPN